MPGPPRVHRHRYCGVLAPNAKLRKAVTASTGPAGTTLQVLQEARRKMGLDEAGVEGAGTWHLSSDEGECRSVRGKIAARCRALLLARIERRGAVGCVRKLQRSRHESRDQWVRRACGSVGGRVVVQVSGAAASETGSRGTV